MLNKKGNALLSVMVAAIIVGLLITSFYLITSPKFAAKDKVTVEGTDITDGSASGSDTGEVGSNTKSIELIVKDMNYNTIQDSDFTVYNSEGKVVSKKNNHYNLVTGNSYTVTKNDVANDPTANSGTTFGPILASQQTITVRIPNPYTLIVKDEFGNNITNFSVFDNNGKQISVKNGKYPLHANESYVITSDGVTSANTGTITTTESIINITLYSRNVEVTFTPISNLKPINISNLNLIIKNKRDRSIVNPIERVNASGKNENYYPVSLNDTYVASLTNYEDLEFTIPYHTVNRSNIDLSFTKLPSPQVIEINFNNIYPGEKVKVYDDSDSSVVNPSNGGYVSSQAVSYKAKYKLRLGKTYRFESKERVTKYIKITNEHITSGLTVDFLNAQKEFIVSSNINPVTVALSSDPNNIITPNIRGKYELELGKQYVFKDPFPGSKEITMQAPSDKDIIFLKFSHSNLLLFDVVTNSPIKTIYFFDEGITNRNFTLDNGVKLQKESMSGKYGLLRGAKYVFEDVYGRTQCQFTNNNNNINGEILKDKNSSKDVAVHLLDYKFTESTINLSYASMPEVQINSNVDSIKVKYKSYDGNFYEIPDNGNNTHKYYLDTGREYVVETDHGDQITITPNGSKTITINFPGYKVYNVTANVPAFNILHEYNGEIKEVKPNSSIVDSKGSFILKENYIYEVKSIYGQTIEVFTDPNTNEIRAIFNLENLSLRFYDIRYKDVNGNILTNCSQNEVLYNGQVVPPIDYADIPEYVIPNQGEDSTNSYKLVPGEKYVARRYINKSVNDKREYFDKEFIVPYNSSTTKGKSIDVVMHKIPQYSKIMLATDDLKDIGQGNRAEKNNIKTLKSPKSSTTNEILPTFNDIQFVNNNFNPKMIEIQNIEFGSYIEPVLINQINILSEFNSSFTDIHYELVSIISSASRIDLNYRIKLLDLENTGGLPIKGSTRIEVEFSDTSNSQKDNDNSLDLSFKIRHEVNPVELSFIDVFEAAKPIDIHTNLTQLVLDKYIDALNENIYNTVIKATN